jgi:NhaP-type Na+/H+ or K+/H+ antiporter/Trk K+ transport system NAD-binding subunit
VLGHRLRIPAIVPLLLFGVLLGPSVLGLVQPDALAGGLSVIVKLAVAVILFEGALNLRLRDLSRAMREVRNLVTIGTLVSWVGASLAAWLIARLSLPVAIVFGALMTVTGPTVVQPILRRVPLPRHVKTVLEGEAILIDPIGAVLAVAVVDIVLGIAGVGAAAVVSGLSGYIMRLLIGSGIGIVGALLLSRLLRAGGVIPTEYANLVALAMTWAVFAAAEWAQSEAGIIAAVAMGLTTQRGSIPEERRLRRFKEELTVLGISLIFVLLAADLPLSVIRAEGWRGILTVLALIFIVRPVAAALSLAASVLTWRERVFVAGMAPRGIVAASVASLFALVLGNAGYAEGDRILAITFLTIAITVTLHGLTAAPLARLLKLQSLAGRSVILVSAGPLALGLARVLQERNRPVAIVDRNRALVDEARRQGFRAIEGNALDELVLEEAGADEAETVIALTTNAEVNALVAHLAHDAFGITRAYPALGHPAHGAGPRLLERVGGRIAFGRPIEVQNWEEALRSGNADFFTFEIPPRAERELQPSALPDDMIGIARERDGSIELTSADQVWRRGDVVVVLSRLSPAETQAALANLAGPRAVEA